MYINIPVLIPKYLLDACLLGICVGISMLAQHTATREERGQAIAQASGQINRIDEMLYIVKSQS
jgi:imidazoleglycerol phosphate synthase glutamine amidotransferase subunit HisH